MKKINIKLDFNKILNRYVTKFKSLLKYNFEDVVTKSIPKNYYAVVKEEHEKDIKEGTLIVCISLLLTKFLVLLMNFCVFFRFNKVLGDFSYVLRITFESIIMKDLANIMVSSIVLVVVPILFLVYILRYHGGRQKTNIYFGMMIFSLLMILKKGYDIVMAFGTITDSFIVMILVMLLYVIAAVGYFVIFKGCLDFCMFAYDECKKDLVKTEEQKDTHPVINISVNSENTPVTSQNTQTEENVNSNN